MRKYLIAFLSVLLSLSGRAQEVTVISKSGIKNLLPATRFAFIEPALDTAFLQYVATIKAEDENDKKVIYQLFSSIKKEANKMGSNCFKTDTFYAEDKQAILVLHCFFAYDMTLINNAKLHPDNVVYVFGKEKEDGGKTFSVSVNGRTQKIEAGKYLRCKIFPGRELKLSKGGNAYRFSWEENQEAEFYTLIGFQPSGVSQPAGPLSSGPTLMFSPGGFNKLPDPDFGWLLVNVLEEVPVLN